MLSSLSLNALRPTRFPHTHTHSKPSQTPRLRPISASLFDQKKKNPDSLIPASPSPTPQLYQPFRPPPSPLPPQFRDLDVNGRLEALSNRLGRWFEYAPLIPTLIQEGFAPPALEEVTGISGVEQNRLVVGAQVRDSLIASGTDSAVIAAFDQGGAEILYEIRLLSAQQRSAAASFMVSRRMDAKAAMELARAMRDFPRRKGDKGWESFNYTLPGDCLAFMYFRQGKEHKNPSEQRTLAMEQALEAAESEAAKKRVSDELSSGKSAVDEEAEIEGAKVPVVRLKLGEIAEATKVVVLPVAKASEGSKPVRDAPRECRSEGEFGVVAAEKGWDRWAVLPAWAPLAGFLSGGAGVAVAFGDARALPWTANRWYKEEPILVVTDRRRTAVEGDDGFYLVEESGSGLRVDRGSALMEAGVGEALGTVVLVVRPPRDEGEDDAMNDEDWD